MDAIVLDSSVLLATLFEASAGSTVALPGRELVMSAASFSELLYRGTARGVPVDVMAASIRRISVRVVPVDGDQAIVAAKLRRFAGDPSLANEVWFCFALAKSTGCRVLTTDAAWLDLCHGVRVEVIR